MGDHNGGDVAQVTHEKVFTVGGVFSEDTDLRHGKPLPSGPYAIGIYLHDLLILRRVIFNHRGSPQAAPGSELIVKAEQAYQSFNLKRAEGKIGDFGTGEKCG